MRLRRLTELSKAIGGLNDNVLWRRVRHFLALAFETRWVGRGSKREKQYRAPSMKTYPPDYYLHGLEFRTASEGERAEVLGVTALECVLHPKHRGQENSPPPTTEHHSRVRALTKGSSGAA